MKEVTKFQSFMVALLLIMCFKSCTTALFAVPGCSSDPFTYNVTAPDSVIPDRCCNAPVDIRNATKAQCVVPDYSHKELGAMAQTLLFGIALGWALYEWKLLTTEEYVGIATWALSVLAVWFALSAYVSYSHVDCTGIPGSFPVYGNAPRISCCSRSRDAPVTCAAPEWTRKWQFLWFAVMAFNTAVYIPHARRLLRRVATATPSAAAVGPAAPAAATISAAEEDKRN